MELGGGGTAQGDVGPVLFCRGVALIDHLVEQGEDGVAELEGAKERGDGLKPSQVFLLFHTICQQCCIGEEKLPEPLLSEHLSQTGAGGAQADHVLQALDLHEDFLEHLGGEIH